MADSNTTEADRLRQALIRVRRSLLAPVNSEAICCTVWMDLPCPETLIDYIDSELEKSGV